MSEIPPLTPLHSFPSPGVHLCGLAWDGAHLWYSDGDKHMLYQLDAPSGRILGRLPCTEVRTGLSYDGQHLWQIAGRPKRIRVIEKGTGEVINEIPLGADAEGVCGLLVGDEWYWTGPESDAYIEQYSRRTHALERRYGPVSSADGIAVIGAHLWYTSYKDGALCTIDLESEDEVKRCALTGSPTDMCWDGRLFWYNDFTNKQICAVLPD